MGGVHDRKQTSEMKRDRSIFSSRNLRRRLAARLPIAIVLVAGLASLLALPGPLAAQDWFKTGTGLGVSKPRVAVADFAPRNPASQTFATLFGDVVRSDLDYSGVVEIASKSFYPTQVPTAPAELNYPVWSAAPVSAQFLAFGGNLTATGDMLEIKAWFYDVQNISTPAVVGRVYHEKPPKTRSCANLRINSRTKSSRGCRASLPGIASTQISYVSTRSGNKEIWAMDYDGANQHELTSLRSISLTPRWSPDAGRIAFTCYPTAGAIHRKRADLHVLDADGKNDLLAALPRHEQRAGLVP